MTPPWADRFDLRRIGEHRRHRPTTQQHGADPGRPNITNPLISALDGGAGPPQLDTSRLRATWLADSADLLGLATVMAAAGISCSQRLGDLAAGLEPAGEADAVRLLGAVLRS